MSETAEPPTSDDEGAGKTDAVPAPDPNNPSGFSSAGDQQNAPPGPIGDAGATRFLASLLSLNPFTKAHQQHSEVDDRHPWRSNIAFTLDALMKVLIYVLILGIVFFIVWKTLAPVQPFWLD